MGLILTVIITAGLISGYAIYRHHQPTQENPTGKSVYNFSGSKPQYIHGYATAPASLQKTLTTQYFDQAKSDCIAEDESLPSNMQLSQVMAVHKIVGSFALVQFCGSGGDSILDNVNGSWQDIGSLADAPTCSLVDQYKISKQIVPQCFNTATGALNDVTYP